MDAIKTLTSDWLWLKLICKVLLHQATSRGSTIAICCAILVKYVSLNRENFIWMLQAVLKGTKPFWDFCQEWNSCFWWMYFELALSLRVMMVMVWWKCSLWLSEPRLGLWYIDLDAVSPLWCWVLTEWSCAFGRHEAPSCLLSLTVREIQRFLPRHTLT